MKDIINLKELKQHILTGISYFIPLVVGAGLTMAIGRALAGQSVANLGENGIGYWMFQTGSLGMQMMTPIFCAYIAFSISGKPELAPGFIIGWLAHNINTGFIGGMVGGVLVGVVVNLCRKYIKLPKTIEALRGMLLIPFLATAVSGMLMFAVIKGPIVWLMATMTAFLQSLSSGSKFLYGGMLGAMATFDFGGPVNKTATAFVNALYAEGIRDAKTVQIIASMIQPLGISLSCLMTRNKYTRQEKETLKAASIMGCFMISEGVIPIAARDLLRVVTACVCGSFVAGGLSMVWGNSSELLNGGFIAFPFFSSPVQGLLSLGSGVVITAAVLSIIKKPVTEADENRNEDLGKELSDEDLDEIEIEII